MMPNESFFWSITCQVLDRGGVVSEGGRGDLERAVVAPSAAAAAAAAAPAAAHSGAVAAAAAADPVQDAG